MIWDSDLDGILGTGREFDEFLSPGAHIVTLSATDSDGNEASTSITLIMEP